MVLPHRWSFQTSSVCMVPNWSSHKLKSVLSRQGGLSRQVSLLYQPEFRLLVLSIVNCAIAIDATGQLSPYFLSNRAKYAEASVNLPRKNIEYVSIDLAVRIWRPLSSPQISWLAVDGTGKRHLRNVIYNEIPCERRPKMQQKVVKMWAVSHEGYINHHDVVQGFLKVFCHEGVICHKGVS